MNNRHNRVEWQADQGIWLIYEAGESSPPRNLEDWADEQTELASISLELAATNYATHWVTLPGVKGRHLNRALPFALEEVLISDISAYTVIPGGTLGNQHKAYVVETDLIDRLLELLAIHHLRLTSLIPETSVYVSGQAVRVTDGWNLIIDRRFEGWVPDVAMPSVLDAVCAEPTAQTLTITGNSLDEANLLKTTVSSGYPDAFDEIATSATAPACVESTINLLHGRASTISREERPRPWWAGIASYAAVLTIMGCGFLIVDNLRMEQKVEQVAEASRSLYKQWFPGESPSNYESKFRRKLRSGGESTGSAGFDSIMGEVAAAWSTMKGGVEVQSIRYSERMDEFLLDVDAKEQGDLQTFKQALESRGLTAEISSAKADKGVVKGRVKVGGAA